MANKIQIKRGNYADLPVLSDAELGFSNDTGIPKRLHIGGFEGATPTNYEILLHQIFDANTILGADADNTPTARTIAEQQVIGRLTGGNIAGIALGIADNNIVQVDGSPADNEFARFTANGLEGLTYAETMAALSGTATAKFLMNSQLIGGGITPVVAADYAIKSYVDAVATGLRDFKNSVRVATIAALPANTPAGSGIGKTITASSVGILTIDSVNTVLGDRILVKDQVLGDDNGIYTVTTEGTAGVAFVLTRATDFDEDAEVTSGAFMFITEGTTLDNQGWILSTNDPITVDTTDLVFVQFSSAGTTVAHKDTHDPNDGTDALDTAAAAEISAVVAAGVGVSHSFSRADHIHAISHAISDNHIVTIDGGSNQPVSTDFAYFTANGLEGKSASETLAIIDGANTKLSNLEDVIAINKSLLPATSDAVALGSATKMWSDVFIGSGGVINFNNGNVSITHADGQIGIGAANLIMTGHVGRDADNYIGWGVDDSLAIKIGATAHAIVSITDGAANNDKLVTQGYVDDLVATADTFIELSDVTEANYTGHSYDLVMVNAAESGLEFMAIIDGGVFA